MASATLPLAIPAVHRDDRLLPRLTDRLFLLLVLAIGYGLIPFIGNDYWFSAILIPFLAASLAAQGLNILVGYTGLLSLGTAAFMAVGAFATYNFVLRIPELPLLASFALGGLTAALVGLLFGLPSLRIRGFYLAVSTLAAQFFVEWALTKFGWFSNHNASGVITAPKLAILGQDFSSPVGRYLLTLTIVLACTLLAVSAVRSPYGRSWMAVRDMEVAAETIGIPVLKMKLLAFAFGCFLTGIGGALWAFTYLGTVEPAGFDLQRSFELLFMVIIGGAGSIIGPFIGAAFIILLPILMSRTSDALFGGAVDSGMLENLQKVIFGALIILVLIKEPRGFAQLLETFVIRLRRRLRAGPTHEVA